MIKNLLFKFINFCASLIAQHRGSVKIEKLVRQLDAFYRKLDNVDFNIKNNGELRVLNILSKFNFRILFDVGANEGQYSLLLGNIFPEAKIHAFEIVPATYNKLLANIKSIENIVPVNHGLGDREEIIEVHMGKGSATATAFKIDGMKFHSDYYRNTHKCPVRTAYDYIIENEIDSIDFVKIDVEGMDYRVIKGFDEFITNIKVVQFEYGIFNISSHDLLADFCKYFKDNDFIVGKIFPKHVAFFDYHFNYETFHGGNFLAVKSNETELIAKLRGYS